MKAPLIFLAAWVAFAWATAARGAPLAVPVPVGEENESLEPSFRLTGLIETAFSWGSGVVAEHPQVVFSCAHVVYDDYYHRWTSGARWYRAYNGTGAPAREEGLALNGYFYWHSYTSAVRASQRAGYWSLFRALAREFNLDAVAFFNYTEDLGAGEFARVTPEGARHLASGIPKWITGYPGGRYAPDHVNEFRLHMTGPFSGSMTREYRDFPNYFTLYAEAETGSGNSGGPVWVSDNTGNTGQQLVAGILVSGLEEAADGVSVIGVHAASVQSLDLLDAARTSAGDPDRVVTRSYTVEPGAVPDALRRRGGIRRSALARPLRITGMPRTISGVKLDLVIEHPRRTDLLVMLQAPANRRLPVYVGQFDTPGADLSLQQEEAALFYGLDPNGTWVLWVFDNRAGTSGHLVSATMHITAH